MLFFYLSLIDDYEDQQKFERVYYQYKDLMHYAANKILNNKQNAEDAVQTAFIKIAQNISKIDEKNCHKTMTFVVIITERVAKTIYRKLQKDNCLPFDELSYDISDGIDLATDVADDLFMAEILEKIAALPNIYSEVLTLKFVHGLSGKQISEVAGISHSAVRKRIERGLNMLNIEIERDERYE